MPFDLLCCVRPGAEDVQELDYAHQSLADVPSDVFTYERTLERLLCQSNRISELPRQLFMCHGLKYLDISDNDLQAIPIAISSLINLRHLNISKNALTSIPDTMKSLKHLIFLDLSVNPLEKLPDAITNLISLQELYLNDTYLEYLPGNFGRLVNLRILELRDNYLMIMPKSLSRSTELVRLDIGQNDFQQFPEVIGKFTKLRELWMDSNSLTNIPGIIQPLENLIHLEVSNNMIEEIAPEISYCRELVDLSISSNNLTQLPESFGNLPKLASLKMDNNKLYELPESLGQLASLEELMLMTNYLDRVPSSIGMLRKLQYLNLDENMLRSIPPEIGSCTKLSVLSVRSNKLTSIPPEIGHLCSLRVLNLVRNSLSCLPQTLLNCDNLVALWLSENQSKPLVPMHSEVDPHTYQQVLTCFLFPQVPLSPIESKINNDKSEQENQNSSRHISFVDVKAPPKIPEKPGQLRRAPTPYPKELRALAKHARNVHKDGAQDISPSVQNAVHIKAAKITPTLQQRFASDHNKDIENNTKETDNTKQDGRESPYDNTTSDNPYDRPLDLKYQPEKTYQGVEHALYSEKNDMKYGHKNPDLASHTEVQYAERPCELHLPRPDMVDGTVGARDIYGNLIYSEGKRRINEIYSRNDHESVNSMQANLQRLSVASSQDRTPTNSSALRHNLQTSYNQMPVIDNHTSSFDHINPVPKPDNYLANRDRDNYHGSVYDSETYAQAKDRIYARRRYDYKYHSHGHRDLPSPRIHTVSQTVTNSATMPNIGHFENVFPGSSGEMHFYSGPDLQLPTPNPPNIYDLHNSSSTYVGTKSPDIYSPTGHDNVTNPYRMTGTPLVSEDGSYSQLGSPLSHNAYNLYEAVPALSSPPTSQADPIYGRAQPPPYHLAAPYTKQAQYFNGTGS